MHVGGDAAVFARVLGVAVDNLQRDHAVRVGDGVVAFGQFFGSSEPLYLGILNFTKFKFLSKFRRMVLARNISFTRKIYRKYDSKNSYSLDTHVNTCIVVTLW